jgi:hypothetical protein
MSADEQAAAIVKARQAACGRHPGSIVRMGAIAQCVHCGCTQATWEALQAEQASNAWANYASVSGGIP